MDFLKYFLPLGDRKAILNGKAIAIISLLVLLFHIIVACFCIITLFYLFIVFHVLLEREELSSRKPNWLGVLCALVWAFGGALSGVGTLVYVCEIIDLIQASNKNVPTDLAGDQPPTLV